jgi:hypothetical protein
MPYLGTFPASELANLDINGQKFILDADADTSITADTDDTIDIEIAGADDFQFTANTFTAKSGSTIAAQAVTATTGVFSSDVTGLTLNATGDTAASDNAAIGYTSAEGLILTGQGSTDDITIKNDADTTVVNVATGSSDIEISAGDLLFGTAGKGVCLGVTTNTNSNTLDDYEEGTFTAVFRVGGTSGTDNGDSTGQYVKVGSLVHVSGSIGLDGSIGGSGNLFITGLPFTCTGITSTASFHFNDKMNDDNIALVVVADATNLGYVAMPGDTSSGAANATQSIMGASSGKVAYFNASYHVDF